jgi:hypothetical protein
VSSAASGDSDAGLRGSAPREVSFANALAGLTVVVVRAIGGNVVASVGQRAPGGSSNESGATTASVSSSATRGDLNAGVGGSAPRLTSRADALTGDAIVSVSSGAKSWQVVASVEGTAPTG